MSEEADDDETTEEGEISGLTVSETRAWYAKGSKATSQNEAKLVLAAKALARLCTTTKSGGDLEPYTRQELFAPSESWAENRHMRKVGSSKSWQRDLLTRLEASRLVIANKSGSAHTYEMPRDDGDRALDRVLAILRGAVRGTDSSLLKRLLWPGSYPARDLEAEEVPEEAPTEESEPEEAESEERSPDDQLMRDLVDRLTTLSEHLVAIHATMKRVDEALPRFNARAEALSTVVEEHAALMRDTAASSATMLEEVLTAASKLDGAVSHMREHRSVTLNSIAHAVTRIAEHRQAAQEQEHKDAETLQLMLTLLQSLSSEE